MIHRVHTIQKALSKLDSQALTFNARLPLALKVLQKLENHKYLLQIGTKVLQTTSHKTLNIGEKYWANMHSTKDGTIILSDLIRRPKILDFINKSPLKITPKELEEMLKELKQDIIKEITQFSLEQMAQPKNKAEFEYFGFVLMGLKNGVLNLSIADKNTQTSLLQIKGARNELTFSAVMPNLGIIEGTISLQNKALYLSVKTNFVNTLELLKSQVSELDGFYSIQFTHTPNLAPLFSLDSQHLLDVKG